MTAAVLSRLGRMSLRDALGFSYEEALGWIEELVAAEKLLSGEG